MSSKIRLTGLAASLDGTADELRFIRPCVSKDLLPQFRADANASILSMATQIDRIATDLKAFINSYY